MEQRVPPSPQYNQEENNYDFPPPPPIMSHNYENVHSGPSIETHMASAVHYRQAPGSFHEARIGSRGRTISPNSEVVVPPSQGVGTLATKFEKQARLVA